MINLKKPKFPQMGRILVCQDARHLHRYFHNFISTTTIFHFVRYEFSEFVSTPFYELRFFNFCNTYNKVLNFNISWSIGTKTSSHWFTATVKLAVAPSIARGGHNHVIYRRSSLHNSNSMSIQFSIKNESLFFDHSSAFVSGV